ncbi:enoyl-CoA hydratase/isomerase family protein [Paraburkholderia sp. Tr-20389]|uniref:enoyl-CoA hydratase/isomerase family protein n=1 Tax=Paraburkholderia sp. Tr-20389 TaxID=2703903 RepID=UPI00197FFBD0|nr:enoyl-CoA hydratase/isomerase family protein [Paraburkholderia sp. Tr-20389]MBN3756437.1 enoyl-CoA hydratase/isomerase family protein [Paraburkholderia sp. Tr-20389]
MSLDGLQIGKRDSQLWIEIDRAGKANAMTVAMMEGIASAIIQASADDKTQAVVLTAKGEKLFCAGVDVREQSPDGDAARQRERRSHALAALQDSVITTPVPIVVALNGLAVGAGAMLALMADGCVAVEGAALSLPEIDIGIATFSGANILTVLGGRALAADLIQTGRRLPAQDALNRGLISAVVERGELEHSATKIAEALGSKNRAAFADNKHWINRGLCSALEEARQEHARHRAKVQGVGK